MTAGRLTIQHFMEEERRRASIEEAKREIVREVTNLVVWTAKAECGRLRRRSLGARVSRFFGALGGG